MIAISLTRRARSPLSSRGPEKETIHRVSYTTRPRVKGAAAVNASRSAPVGARRHKVRVPVTETIMPGQEPVILPDSWLSVPDVQKYKRAGLLRVTRVEG